MENKKNVVGWFELPVSNMERAINFYKNVFNYEFERHQMGPLDMAWFPMEPGGIGAMGALVENKDFYEPSTNGALIYFSSFSGDLNNELNNIEKFGGKIIVSKKQISEEHGYMAVCIDSEGNRIALHSQN